ARAPSARTRRPRPASGAPSARRTRRPRPPSRGRRTRPACARGRTRSRRGSRRARQTCAAMSCRYFTPPKSMRAAASYAAVRARSTVAPSAVTQRMRPPFVTRVPPCSAVPAWNTSAPVAALRVVAPREDDRDRRLPPRRELDAGDVAGRARGERLEQVAVEAGEERLRLRVPETAVELEHARAALGQHQPGEEAAGERRPAPVELGEHRDDDVGDEAVDLGVRERGRGR